MSEEDVDMKDKKKGKGDYAEVEFEIGNIEFEAKGRSIVVERMFRLLLEKIEEGKLVATFRLPDDDDEEEEEEEEEEFPIDELITEEEIYEEEDESSDEDDTKERIKETLEDTLREIDDAVPSEEEFRRDSEREIPSEAYLDPPPAWDTLDDDSPPESSVEKESMDESE